MSNNVNVYYDPNCRLCYNAVSFAKKNDKNNSLTFLPNDLLKDKDLDIKNTVIVKDGDRDLKKSEAVILMLDKINFKKTSFFIKIFPTFKTKFVAKYIYRNIIGN